MLIITFLTCTDGNSSDSQIPFLRIMLQKNHQTIPVSIYEYISLVFTAINQLASRFIPANIVGKQNLENEKKR